MKGPTIALRLRSAAEHDAIAAAAANAGMRKTEWMRKVLLEAAGVPTDERPEAQRARAMRLGEPDPWGKTASVQQPPVKK